ncbi:MAG: FHA domain-containing protein [Ruminococcaceae bacterium]|nr:FHA domain-containing protein [Oscillospiraceae bacterium]
MLKRLRLSICLLLVCMLTFACFSPALAADAESSLANLRVRFKVTVPALDDAEYIVWASGVAFAVGDPGNTAAYYVTDAALLDYEAVLGNAASAILTELESGGITGVTADTLSKELEVDSVETVLYVKDAERPVTLVTAEDGWALLGIIETADYVDAPTLSLTTTIPTGDVTYWSAGDAAFGITRTTQPNAGFLRLSGSVAAIDGDYVTLSNDYSPLSLGSPLVDTAGLVFGIVVSDPDSGEISAVGAQSLRDALLSVGVLTHVTETLTEKTEALAETDSFRQIIMIATAAAGLLLILIIILLIVRSRRPAKRHQEPVRHVDTGHSYSAPRAAAASVTPVRRDPTPAPAAPAPAKAPAAPVKPTAPASPPPPSVLLTVLDGRLQGYTQHVSATAVIGRDPKCCSVVFGASQTEISRRHCQITYNPATGDVILEDIGSANGTYTPDGRRFAAGRKYLLRSGDRFYLGVKENMIEVRK